MMREGWEYKKIGNICNITTGKLDANAANEDGLYPFFTCSRIPLSINTYAYDCESILIAGNGDLNVKYYNGKFNAYQRTYILQLKNDVNGIEMRYIFAFFNLYIEELRRKSIGGIIKYIKLGDLTNALLPLPDITTQLAIVSELDKINELIRLKEEQLKDFDNLAQSIFYEMFGDPVENEMGWEVKKLSSLFKVSSSKRIMQEEWTKEGVPFLKVSDIVSLIKYGEVSPSTFISQLKFEKLEKANMVPMVGDILITSRGTLGLCYTIKTGDKFYFQDGMVTWLSENSGDIIPIYITYLFSNNHFLEVLAERANKSTVSYISIKQISQKKITIPPLPLQHLFAHRIEQIEHQKSEVQKAITDLETLLASRMQYWFE